MTFDIDIGHNGGPHWLSLEGKGGRAGIRAKHRALWEAKHPRQRIPMSAVTKARLDRISDHQLYPIMIPVRRKRLTPHNAAVHGFAVAIKEAEKHRRTLKRRFGYNDQQIGTMALIHNSRKRTP